MNILSVGEGDLTISFDKTNKAESERAAKIVDDMLRQGYAILVNAGKKGGEPVYRRVKSFDPATDEYVVMGGPDERMDLSAARVEPEKKRRGRPSKAETRVPARSVTGVSVARSAGGYDPVLLDRAAKVDRRCMADYVGRLPE